MMRAQIYFTSLYKTPVIKNALINIASKCEMHHKCFFLALFWGEMCVY